jgi:hypothetical protein
MEDRVAALEDARSTPSIGMTPGQLVVIGIMVSRQSHFYRRR